MPNNSSNSDQSAYDSHSFQEGLTALSDCQYNLAYKSFNKTLDDYEKSNTSRDSVEYYGLRFFRDFAKGLELLGIKGGFTRSRDFFSSALIWSKKLPPEVSKEIIPTIDFFSRMFPLDERLRGLFAHPQSFEHLAEGLNLILEPLSEILTDSYMIETLPLVRILVTARANICMVILYLLGKLPSETLFALVRDKEPEGKPDDLVLWILNQEQRALMETGCDKLHQLLPAVSHFAREMVRLGAPENINEIPEITKQRLLSLLAPLRELDISAGTILEPILKRLLKEHSSFIPVNLPTDKKTMQITVPSGLQWLDLLLVIYPKAKEIEMVIGKMRKRFSFRELGLVHRGSGKINTLGKVLILLAEHSGVIGWHTTGADAKLKKQLSLLARLLKSIFPGLAGSPFYPYKQYKAYKTRFKIEVSYIGDESSAEDEDETFDEDRFRKSFRRYKSADKDQDELNGSNAEDD